MSTQQLPSTSTTDVQTAHSDGQWGDWLVCPKCGAALREKDQELLCQVCQLRWPIIDGIPHFIKNFPYWGEISLEQVQEVNRLADNGSWKAPLLASSDPTVVRAAEMILNLHRANWQWLLDLPRDSRVLDLGAGMGTNSHALALHYSQIVAVEPVLERVQFMRRRFAHEGLSNTRIIRSSVWDLPFAKQSFDLVVMNGVLEWVAEGLTEDPAELQGRALRRAFELLRPGGYLYLGIENRMCLGYFIGYPDPHCGLPFVTVLPRPLAHWYAKRKGQAGGYRNYLYSSRGYRKLLEKAGFQNVNMHLAIPSYNHPKFIIPLKGNIFSYYSRNFIPSIQGRLRRFARYALLALGLQKYFEYSFAIFARK